LHRPDASRSGPALRGQGDISPKILSGTSTSAQRQGGNQANPRPYAGLPAKRRFPTPTGAFRARRHFPHDTVRYVNFGPVAGPDQANSHTSASLPAKRRFPKPTGAFTARGHFPHDTVRYVNFGPLAGPIRPVRARPSACPSPPPPP